MNTGHLIFTQIASQIHREQFERCASKHPMPRASRSFSARDQFLCMLFAQLTYRESLRDIEACLAAQQPLLYAMGIRGRVTRTNLAYANENRDWRVYRDLAQILIRKAQSLYAEEQSIDLGAMAYALDSTTIDLSLSLFPWATFQKTKSAVRLHTLMQLPGSIPVSIEVTKGIVHDVNAMDSLNWEPGCYYVLDRGYLDFERLYRIHCSGAFFVVRSRRNIRLRPVESLRLKKSETIRCDQLVRLKYRQTRPRYPECIRRIRTRDTISGSSMTILTNCRRLPAETLAQFYRNRWSIETFFKWIKQNLRIKSFYGHSPNAVKTQIWIATIAYLLVAILNKRLGNKEKLSRILQVISVNAFSKVPVDQLLNFLPEKNHESGIPNQLIFNDLLTGH